MSCAHQKGKLLSLVINSNVLAQESARKLVDNSEKYNKTLRQLASGNRINTAGDDPTGAAISKMLESKVRSSEQALRNTHDSISLMQIMDGGFAGISDVLTRLRELTLQASTDTLGDVERSFIQEEVRNSLEEITRIAESTKYNNTKLLSRSVGDLDFQIGINHGKLGRKTFDLSSVNCTLENLGLTTFNTSTKENAHKSIDLVNNAILQLNQKRAAIGGFQNGLEATRAKNEEYTFNTDATKSRIRDADFAEKASDLAREKIMTDATAGVLVNANQKNALALKLIL